MKVYKVTIRMDDPTEIYLVTDDPKKIYDHRFSRDILKVELISDCEVLK